MSGKNNQARNNGNQRAPTNLPNNAMARLSLNPTGGPSAVPKRPQRTQQDVEDANDVIYANHFPCSFARDLAFYQYDVLLEQYHDKRNRYVDVLGREKRRRMVNDMLLDKSIHPTAVCWYDEGSCVYSTSILKDTFPFVYEKEIEGRRYRLTITSLTATSGTNDLDHSSIRIIETLIKQALKEQFKSIGSVFYRWDAECTRDGPYDLLNGFKQALCLTASGPTLNVDTTITRFYPHSDLLAFIWERLLGERSDAFRGSFSDHHYHRIGLRLKGIEVTTAQSENRTTYILTGDFSNQLPAQVVINPEQNLLAYYKGIGFELRHPGLYCVRGHKIGNPQNVVDLPIELCQLGEWQPVKEDESINPVPAPAVNDRFRSIMAAVGNCNFADDALFREIQLDVDCAEMMAVPYETLQQRHITTGRQGGFTQPVAIDKMGFIYLADRRQPNAREMQEKLLNSFYDAANRQRMRLPDNPDECEIIADRNLRQRLQDRLAQLKEEQCQFILCLENCQDPQIHELFKQIACIEMGLVTQCANFHNIQRIRNLKSYCENLLQSVNAKMSGENKRVTQLSTTVKTMFVGADVLHSKSNYSGELPSIAAVVASMNSECTLTNQRVSRQWPLEGKQSEEAILLLNEMFQEQLLAFRDNNGGALPERVIFYRDGVDDGQFERVHREEVEALTNVFRAVYPAKSAAPRLTFIVVKKRHHTRLFRRCKPQEVANVASGVVVDNNIVNPRYTNFFLNSHPPGLGTNKLGHYVVLVDENQFLLNDLEEMTYSLCHTDQRISNRASESIPSVLHLADAAASKARQLFGRSPRPAGQARAEMLVVHEDMQNAPNMF